VDISGGTSADGVQHTHEKLDDEAAARVEKTLRTTVQARQRDESAEDIAQR
jgi:hypothetical protein